MHTSEALATLAAGKRLINCRVEGHLDLTLLATDAEIRVPIVIRNVIVESLQTIDGYFHNPVILERIQVVGETEFWCGYFFAGFQASQCRFNGAVDFQCGGHNREGNVFSLNECQFSTFVNFFDCWFNGPVYVQDCSFESGSNLLGNRGMPYQVRFDIEPIIERNTGILALNET